jgi:hypothetical protein
MFPGRGATVRPGGERKGRLGNGLDDSVSIFGGIVQRYVGMADECGLDVGG